MQQEKLRQLNEKYKLDSLNEHDEDDGSDIDELGNTVVPSEQKVNNTIRRRKISVEGKVKDLAQEELLHKLSEKDTEQKLFEQSEDFEDKYSFTEQEIEKKQKNIKDLEKNYRENDAFKLQDMSTLEQHMQSLQNQKEQLVLYVEERQELMQVEDATPNPLRSAHSELTLFDSSQPAEVGFPFRTSSMSALGAEDDSLSSLSKRDSNASSSSLNNSMGSQDSINSIGEVRKKSPHRRSLNADGSLLPGYTIPSQRRRLSAPALDVTSRLYQTPNVPKVKKTEFKKAAPKPTQHREKLVARPVEVKWKDKKVSPMKFSGTPFSNKVNSLSNSELDSQLTNKGRQFSRLSSKIKSASSLASVPEALNEEAGDTASVKPDAVKMRNRTRYPGESERRHSAPVDIIANFKKSPAKSSSETEDKKKEVKSAKPKRTFKSVVRNVISKCIGASAEKDQTKAKEDTPKPVKAKVAKTDAKPASKREHEKKREPFKRPGKKVKLEDIPVEIFVAPVKSPVTTVSEGCNVDLIPHVSTVDVVVHEQFSDDSLNGDDKNPLVMADSLETDDSGPQLPETKSQGVSTSQEELALPTNDPFNVCASDSLADAQQKLQLLQQALSHLSEK